MKQATSARVSRAAMAVDALRPSAGVSGLGFRPGDHPLADALGHRQLVDGDDEAELRRLEGRGQHPIGHGPGREDDALRPAMGQDMAMVRGRVGGEGRHA